tara:strand:- start:4581 stop:5243 length:663 start_codon:yes stop_codon:yes gene_type:complete
MAFMDDLKSDQRTQIMAGGVIFFLIAFPVYFNLAADNAEEVEISGPIGNYTVNGTLSYHTLASATEYINDGETLDLSINTDTISSEIEDLNIVGVRAILTYQDDEQAPAGCGSAPDDVSGHLMHGDLHNTETVSSGAEVNILWQNVSIVDTTVENKTQRQIDEMLTNKNGTGYGVHYLQISVDVNQGSCLDPIRETNDNGEQIEYEWQLISLEYDLALVE